MLFNNLIGDNEMNTQERTQQIIDNYRDNKDRFNMLKGILCMNHGWDIEDDKRLYELIDFSMIACEMDRIQLIRR